MRLTLSSIALLAAACGSGGGLSGDHPCSIDLDVSEWIEPQAGVLERSATGPLGPGDVDGLEAPTVGKMCWAHSTAQPARNGEYLVDDVGQWVQDYPGHADPQTYVVHTNARLGKLAQ